MFMPKNVCQSCGMPLKKDVQGGGTEANGHKSIQYCSHCYQVGMFTEPTITCAQMQDKVYEKLKEMKFPGFAAKWFSRGIPKLKRWQV